MKKLIIVCEEKLHRYGDFLAQLISGSDDKEEVIVGIKDGAVAAQVWTEKEYASNAAQISSEQYLLFIGNSKLIKEKRHHMQKKYSDYGMNYGWLGKQAVLFVDRSLTFSEYETFYQLASNEADKSDQPGIIRLLPEKIATPAEEIVLVEDELNESRDEDAESVDQEAQEKKDKRKLLVPFAAAKVAIRKTTDQGKSVFTKLSENINMATKGKEIEEQQYTCLVLMFYLKDLGKFLGLHEG